VPWRVAFARNWCCEPARVLDALGRGGRPGLAGSTRTKTRLPRCVRVSMDSCLAPASISQHCRANGARSGADPQLQDEKERVTFASWEKHHHHHHHTSTTTRASLSHWLSPPAHPTALGHKLQSLALSDAGNSAAALSPRRISTAATYPRYSGFTRRCPSSPHVRLFAASPPTTNASSYFSPNAYRYNRSTSARRAR